jgi:hypothetical protein
MPPKPNKSKRTTFVSANSFLPFSGVSGLLKHTFLWFAVVTTVLLLTAQHYWQQFNQELLPTDQFAVKLESFEINEKNEWLDVSPKFYLASHPEFSVQSGHAQRSLLDPALVGDLAKDVSQWPFVRAVKKIQKSANGIELDLEYRRPIAVVELMNSSRNWLVDEEGRLIPGNMQAGADGQPVFVNHAGQQVDVSQKMLRINLENPQTQSLEHWQVWPDGRIVDACRVADQLQEVIDEFGLYRVLTIRPHGDSDSVPNPQWPYEVWTAVGTRIIWSDNPLQETNESRDQKIQSIRQWIATNGSLDQLVNWKKLDVRSGQAVLVTETLDTARRTWFQ